MIYAYIRVSTEHQTLENQRYEIEKFCLERTFVVDKWVKETVSGRKDIEQRKLGCLLNTMKKGDTLICAEISRLGRNLLMIMGILHECMKRDLKVWTIKDNYRLGDDISSKVLAFAFALSAEIERNLISQRTKEALARRKAEGKRLGRPLGSKSVRKKLTGHECQIVDLLSKRKSLTEIGRKFKVHRKTVKSFIAENKL